MAEGLKSHPGLMLESAYIHFDILERGKKEDLRVLVDILRPDGFLVVENSTEVTKNIVEKEKSR